MEKKSRILMKCRINSTYICKINRCEDYCHVFVQAWVDLINYVEDLKITSENRILNLQRILKLAQKLEADVDLDNYKIRNIPPFIRKILEEIRKPTFQEVISA